LPVHTTTAASPSHATPLPMRSFSLSMAKARRRSACIRRERCRCCFRALVSTIVPQNAIASCQLSLSCRYT